MGAGTFLSSREGVSCRLWGQPEQWRGGGNYSSSVSLEQKGRERPGVRLAGGTGGWGPGQGECWVPWKERGLPPGSQWFSLEFAHEGFLGNLNIWMPSPC